MIVVTGARPLPRTLTVAPAPALPRVAQPATHTTRSIAGRTIAPPDDAPPALAAWATAALVQIDVAPSSIALPSLMARFVTFPSLERAGAN